MIRKYALFACCLPVNGYNRSLIVDIQRGIFRFIPNGIYDILQNKSIDTTELIKDLCESKEDEAIIQEYLDFLIENEYVFEIAPEIEDCFPKLNLDFECPERITNSIIDINEYSNFNLKNIFHQIYSLSCYTLQLRFYHNVDYIELVNIIELVIASKFRCLNLIIKKDISYSEELMNDLLKKYPFIQTIIVYSNDFDKTTVNEVNKITYTTEKVKMDSNCGIVDPTYFILNQKHFLESQSYNTCLNKKVCIDVNGEIKNCPSMTNSYGNIKDVLISDVVKRSEFMSVWNINKDKIDVCMDCEFRHMCTDCRCFIKSTTNIYSQPTKCGYNPYIAKWSKEDGYISVEEWRALNPGWEMNSHRKQMENAI